VEICGQNGFRKTDGFYMPAEEFNLKPALKFAVPFRTK
jgi:hypothetical protein